MELIVVDGGSTDNTLAIASGLGAHTIPGDHKLLAARRIGAEMARGEVVVLLDSDQVLCPRSLDSAAEAIRSGGFDMVALGERVASPGSWYSRLADADKQLLEFESERQLDPNRGVIMPRVFRRSLLLDALSRIPRAYDSVVIAMDHAMIYQAAHELSARVAFHPRAVLHQEPSSIREVWRKNFRYGRSMAQQRQMALATPLITSKLRRLGYTAGPLHLRIASQLFLAVKAPALALGIAQCEFQSHFQRHRSASVVR